MNNVCMCASRLRMDTIKMQVMCQQLSQVDFSYVPVLSKLFKVAESARELRVLIDSQLSLSIYVVTLCQSGFYNLRQVCPLARSI